MKLYKYIIMLLLCVGFCQAHYSVYTLSQLISRLSQTESIEEIEIVHLGNHIVAEFLECANLDAYDELEAILRNAAEEAGATVLKVVIHKFEPVGVSGFALLAESHVSFHTWPEFGYVAVDTYTCGSHVNVYHIIEVLKAFFKPKKVRHLVIDRGYDTYDGQ